MKKTILLSSILFATVILSCEEKPDLISEEIQSETSMEGNVSEVTSEKEQFCFRNETPYNNGEDSLFDVENLEFTVEGDMVKGKFEWIPAEKGGLSGEISGTKKGNEIDVVYNETYAEEPYPISLKIIISSDEAVVTSTDESFGSYNIKKSTCK